MLVGFLIALNIVQNAIPNRMPSAALLIGNITERSTPKNMGLCSITRLNEFKNKVIN
jgi:hypothetical protein